MTRRFIISLCFLILPFLLLAAGGERPKVGLVLSGGGAKGLAHIGVLKVLEEAGIRPDYITGTSMGSIIGGLYAIGYSAAELDSIVTSLNWSLLLSDRIPLSNVIPEEKLDYHRFHVELDIKKDGLVAPVGLIGGQSISELLSRLSAHVAGIESFDDYPIPFRSVAADLLTGEQVVFDSGSFSTALRASMSIPSVFSPVELDTLYLIDGGVLNNFPVDICLDMGADIIIGVNVGNADRVPMSELGSIISVLSASAMIGNSANNRSQLPLVDVLISPDLSLYNVASFFNGPQIIQKGEEAARESFHLIDSLAVMLNSMGEAKPLIVPPDPGSYIISEIQTVGLENVSRRFFLSGLQIAVGDTIDFDILEHGVSRLMGTRYFESLTYDLKPGDEGYVLKLTANESARAKFKFSLHYDNENRAGILANITLRNILLRGNRMSTTYDISERPRFNLSLINYHGENHLTGSRLDLNWERSNFPVYLDDGAVYGSFFHNYTDISFGIMSSIDTKWEIDAYLEYERSMMHSQTGMYELFSSGINKFGNVFISANFNAYYNTLNRRFFPTSGNEAFIRYRFYIDSRAVYHGDEHARDLVAEAIEPANRHFFELSGSFQKFIRLSRKWVVSPRVQANYSDMQLPLPGRDFVGGMPFQRRSNEVSFVGMSSREKVVQNYILAQLNLRYRFRRNLNITGVANGMMSFNGDGPELLGFLSAKDEKILGYGLLLEYDSVIGPVQLGVSNSNMNRGFRWYVGLGYPF